VGNFSRDTFDPAKNYVAVRLQQGVPFVDADFNEAQDVTRNELYEGLRSALPSIARRGGLDVSPAGAGDDIVLSPGAAVIDGRPIQVLAPLRYGTQRYANAATAAADGVTPVVPLPLNQPAAPRTDTAYLDVFEREVRQAEDGNIVNPAIGVETATRRRREVVLRVAEGASSPPAPAAGHVHLAVALLNRTAAPVTAAQIADVKPYALPLGPRELAFQPLLQPIFVPGVAINAPWTIEGTFGAAPRLVARKLSGTAGAVGIIPVELQDRARLLQVRLRGQITVAASTVFLKLIRSRHDFGGAFVVAEDAIAVNGTFDRSVPPAPAEAVVDAAANHYFLHILCVGNGAVELYGGAIRFSP
jgi:hypothetical protein